MSNVHLQSREDKLPTNANREHFQTQDFEQEKTKNNSSPDQFESQGLKNEHTDSNGCNNQNGHTLPRKEESFPHNPRGKPRTSSRPDRKAVPIIKSEKRIATSYTPFAFIIHLTIISQHLYTLSTTPSTSVSSLRLTSFTQLIYITTTLFHILTFLANLTRRYKLERALVLYGTWVIWTGWAMVLCLINPSNKPDALLAAATPPIEKPLQHPIFPKVAIAPFLMHGNWITTTLPIISFILIMIIRRNHWGLITWEHLVLLELQNTLTWYRVWCIAGAGAGWMLTWEAAKFWFHVPFSFIGYDGALISYRTDIPHFPGLFTTLCASLLSGGIMICWWSFWTFQYRGVVWKKELVEGVAVMLSDDGMKSIVLDNHFIIKS